MRYSLINNPNKDYAPDFYYEITADIYNHTTESWSYEVVRNWFFTLNEAKKYYLFHPKIIKDRLYSNLHIYKCYKEEYPSPNKNGFRRYDGVIIEQVL